MQISRTDVINIKKVYLILVTKQLNKQHSVAQHLASNVAFRVFFSG